jgi:hypothetical protein
VFPPHRSDFPSVEIRRSVKIFARQRQAIEVVPCPLKFSTCGVKQHLATRKIFAAILWSPAREGFWSGFKPTLLKNKKGE